MDRNTYQNDEFARTLHDEALTVHGTDAIDGDRQPYGPPGFSWAIQQLLCYIVCSVRCDWREGVWLRSRSL